MEIKRKLDFEVETSADLNKMLTGALMDVRRGNLDHDVVKSITTIVDKVNKNNANAINYKKVSKHNRDIDFFNENNE